LIRIVGLEDLPGDTEVKTGQAYQGLDERESGGCVTSGKLRGIMCSGKTLCFHMVVGDTQGSAMEKEV